MLERSYRPASNATAKAKEAINQLCGFYPPPQASDGRAFLAGMVTMLAEYPHWLIALVAHPARGIPATNKFFPNLAELKQWLDAKAEAEEQHRSLERRYTFDPSRALEGPSLPQRSTNNATRSALCVKYGIRDVPPGWGAVEVALAHGRYGEKFHEEIEKALQNKTRPPTIFSRVVEKARQAMDARQSEITISPQLRAQLAPQE